MARNAAPKDAKDADPAKQGRLSQIRAVFTMTRKSDPAVVWLMLLAFVGAVALGLLIGLLIDHPIYVSVLGAITGVLLAVIIMGRRAERAAYTQIADQKGAAGYALKGLRKGWNVEEQPVAVDPRTQDLVFRAIGRPGIVLVTEGPVPRVNKLVDQERLRLNRVLRDVPVVIFNAGPGEGQVPLQKLSRTIMRKRPVLTKAEVSEVSKRLRALGSAGLPIPKGVDPGRMRPDRKANKGR
jgi:F0F1-type ATP synthase assembly protein I